MKNFKSYLLEAEQWMNTPTVGDDFAIELEDLTLLETYVLDQDEQGNLLLDSTEEIWTILESWNFLEEDKPDDQDDGNAEVDYDTQEPDIKPGAGLPGDDDKPIDYTAPERPIYTDPKLKHLKPADSNLKEAEYQGRKVPLGKPMRGDVKKFKVYVRDPKTGNVKKVNFGHGGTSAKKAGQKTMKIKKSNPARRRSFRARHNCDNPGPRTKARYWSCRAW